MLYGSFEIESEMLAFGQLALASSLLGLAAFVRAVIIRLDATPRARRQFVELRQRYFSVLPELFVAALD